MSDMECICQLDEYDRERYPDTPRACKECVQPACTCTEHDIEKVGPCGYDCWAYNGLSPEEENEQERQFQDYLSRLYSSRDEDPCSDGTCDCLS